MSNVQLNISLTFDQLIEAVKQLSPKEKLMLNDAIWDEIMEIPLEQQALVLQRKHDMEENPDNMLDWEEASKTLPLNADI
jgi:hypothetical protein